MWLDASQEAHLGIEINPYPFPSQMPSRHKDPVVQLLSHVRLFVTQWTAAFQASLPFTISWSLLKLMSIESVMPSNHFILYRPILLLPSIFPSIRVFSNESALCIRWPEYRNFSFSIRASSEFQGSFLLGLTGDLLLI